MLSLHNLLSLTPLITNTVHVCLWLLRIDIDIACQVDDKGARAQWFLHSHDLHAAEEALDQAADTNTDADTPTSI